MSHADYLEKALIHKYREDSLEIASRFVGDADAIVVTGISGAVYGGALAAILGLDLVVVRKDKNNHSGRNIEWGTSGNRLFIVDDLVSSGETMRRIRDKLFDYTKLHNFTIDIVGIYLYDDEVFYKGFEELFVSNGIELM